MSCDGDKVLNSIPKRSSCPICGVPNKCAMEEGKSITACWCFGVPPIENLSGEAGECLCRSCLTKLLSPCRSECELDSNGLKCNGCNRTKEQIKLWSSFTLEEKLTIMTQLETGNK